jgi:SAM-dependent methyltransferase
MHYQDVVKRLQASYDASAAERDQGEVSAWKVREREVFLELLRERGAKTLLELGSGPGRDGIFFQEQGLGVTCTDLSPAMVAHCREKGLEAHVMDFLGLDLGRTFDAVYALNSLLHVPKADLPAVLERVRKHLNPGGLFYFGVYGGLDFEGIWTEDKHEPKRFFAYYRDHELLERVMSHFELLYFRRVHVQERNADFHFQSMVWQYPYSRYHLGSYTHS